MKRGLVCLNGDGHGLLCHCRHQGLLAVGGHVLVSRDTSLGEPDSATRSLASALSCGVTVTVLRAHGILLGKSEAVVHETTVTTGIDRVTIHELLLAQRRQIARGDEPSTFERTRGRKSPTRATLSLVLHWRHRSLRGPVHRIRKWFADVLMSSQVLQATPHIVGLIPSVLGHEFTGRQVRKLIHLQPVREILGICGVDKVHVALEDLETSTLVGDSIVYFAIFRFEVIPHQIIVRTRGRCARRAQQQRGSNAR